MTGRRDVDANASHESPSVGRASRLERLTLPLRADGDARDGECTHFAEAASACTAVGTPVMDVPRSCFPAMLGEVL